MNKAKHVLVIDDNDVDNFIAERIIKVQQAAEIITVKKSAVAALDFLHHQAFEMGYFPDYIFLDLNMPGMDGFGFLSEYEKFPPALKEKTKIIIVTSSEDTLDREKAKRNPWVKKFILKPLTVQIIDSIN